MDKMADSNFIPVQHLNIPCRLILPTPNRLANYIRLNSIRQYETYITIFVNECILRAKTIIYGRYIEEDEQTAIRLANVLLEGVNTHNESFHDIEPDVQDLINDTIEHYINVLPNYNLHEHNLYVVSVTHSHVLLEIT